MCKNTLCVILHNITFRVQNYILCVKVYTVCKNIHCVKVYTVCKIIHCVQNYTLCVKLHTVCSTTHFVQNYTIFKRKHFVQYQIGFFPLYFGKFYTRLNFFTQPSVVMVVTNMRCVIWPRTTDNSCRNNVIEHLNIEIHFTLVKQMLSTAVTPYDLFHY